jgi:two-component system response regulator RegA
MNQTHKILIVDDDEVFCQVLGQALSRRGFDVEQALDQASAVESMSRFRPERAVVDLRIGQDSGLNLIQELLEINPNLRIVVLTGYASISTAVESIKLGAVQYLTKPAPVEDILAGFEKQTGDSAVAVSNQPLSAKRMEWEHLQKVLNDHGGNISAAARAMGMHRRTLQRKLAKKPVRQ